MSQDDLHEGVVALSEANDWPTARLEWELDEIYKADEAQRCMCGHYPIIEICVIRNRLNDNSAEIGNQCVKNFLESEILFSSLRRVLNGQSSSFNEEMLWYAYRKGYISERDWKFYVQNWRKRNLSPKQQAWKNDINQRILKHVCR